MSQDDDIIEGAVAEAGGELSVTVDQVQTHAQVIDRLAGRRRVTGRNGAQLTPFDSESARQAALKRWDDYRQAAEVAAVLEVQRHAPGISEPAAAYGVAVGAQMRVALDGDHPASPAAFRNVRQALGADIGKPEQARDAGGVTNQTIVVVSDAVAQRVLRRVTGTEHNKSGDRG